VTYHCGSTSAANTSQNSVIIALGKEGLSSHEIAARVGYNQRDKGVMR
jgi:hypothetical protein